MSPIPKHKLCWQCEGNVGINQDHCPYCGVYLDSEANFSANTEEHTFTPPYKIPIAQDTGNSDVAREVSETPLNTPVAFIKTLLLLLMGSTLTIFAFVLYLFGQDGHLTLQWNSDIWYFYILVSIPLLWAGWKSL